MYFASFRLVLLTALGCTGCSVTINTEPPSATPVTPVDPVTPVTPATQAPADQCGTTVDLGNGYVRCEDGSVNRAAASTSDPLTNRPPECGGDETYLACTTNADCTEGPNGQCSSTGFLWDTGGAGSCNCTYGCSTDADCAIGQACLDGSQFEYVYSGPLWSQCVQATCTQNADCESGECGVARWFDGCGTTHRLACRTANDTCSNDDDCDGTCGYTSDPDDHFSCSEVVCDVGRPLHVDGTLTTAPSTDRADWHARSLGVLDSELAAHWTSAALYEHASVASFSAVSLELMALGAPPDLLRDTHAAALDEIRHAELCFALASKHSANSVGPGALPLAGFRVRTEPQRILEALIQEACIGETLSAAIATREAELATDPEVHTTLTEIAADEQRHAALGWRTLKWLLSVHPELTEQAETLLHNHLAELRSAPPDLTTLHRPEAGVLGGTARQAVRQQAVEELLTPCIRALVA